VTDNIDDDAGQQQALLMLVRAFLHEPWSVLRVKWRQQLHLRTMFANSAGWTFVRRVGVVAGRMKAVSSLVSHDPCHELDRAPPTQAPDSYHPTLTAHAVALYPSLRYTIPSLPARTRATSSWRP
jgi:hypothetical protein